MFGIGGGELIFIMFIVLMLFGSDKIPEIARTVGKTMAQIKNATNDIKSEIQKGAEANGFDKQSLADLTGNITAEIDKAKENLLGDTSVVKDFSNSVNSEIKQVEQGLTSMENTTEAPDLNQIPDIEGPIKRQV
ncbi:MAG: twin-arginine translocase TatA/TatE family subunit [Flavobacterium sp.]|nr:twin-arginine translocase TatA/TatE family subunit [Flavobacterium sp.]